MFQNTAVTDHNKVKIILGDIETVRGFVNFSLALVENKDDHVVTEVMGLTVEEVQLQRSLRE